VSDQTANFGPGGGGVLATTDGGAVWKRQRLPSDTSGLFGISCVTTLDCEAVGGTPLDDAAVVAPPTGARRGWRKACRPGLPAVPSEASPARALRIAGLLGATRPEAWRSRAMGERRGPISPCRPVPGS
jgi:hypothetical protein